MKHLCILKSLIFIISFFIISNVFGQINIHQSDFSTSQGEAFTTTGSIGTSSWSVSRSGDDWGARIHNNILELTNTASTADNANGWVYAYLETVGFNTPYNTTFSDNTGKLTWYFNMRQIRSDPAGFGSTNYGVAFILGSTSNNIAAEGSGYAVVLGNTGSPDPIRFVKFTGGIQSLGTALEGLIIADEPLNDPKNNHLSLKLSYDPNINEWKLFGRNDGSNFQDPQSGELSLLGSIINDEYTNVTLDYMGTYWQGSTAANQTAFFNNISVWIDEPGPTPPAISNIIQTPDSNITPETTVSVSADVTPGDSPVIESVELIWGISDDELTNTIPMSQPKTTTYITDTDIPGHDHNTTVYYKIIAEDEDGETGISSLQSYLVIDPDIDLEIVSVDNPDDINVDFGTLFEGIPLPETVIVTLDNDDTEELDVEWEEGDYDANVADTYTLTGIIQLTEGIANTGNHTASVSVTVNPEEEPGEIVIAGWTFPEAEMFGANLGIEENIDKPISREEGFTGSYSFFAGVSDQSISTRGWVDGEDTKYWTVEFSTLNYKELNLSSAQQSSNTGPRDFKVQYRVGDQEWIDVDNSQVTVANNFTSGLLEELPLPIEVQNKASVSLRWIMTSNTSVDDGTVASTGASRIDNIFIKGLYDSDFIRIVSGVEEPASISVEQGTAFNDLTLPETVTVQFEDLGIEILGVEWLEGEYDANLLGDQTIEGNLQLEGNMDNPNEIKAEITVVVMEEILNITQVQNFDPVMVYTGVAFDNLGLPQQAQVSLSDDSTTELDVVWLQGDYDPEVPATYIIQGDLVMETGISNPDNHKAEIDVIVEEPDMVAGWTFPVQESREANLGVERNLGNLISREDGFTGSYTYHDGVTDYSVGAITWAEGQDSKYWLVELSTTGYKDLILSSAQYSTPAGPRDFKIQYKLGTHGWEDVPDTDIPVASDFTQGVISRVPLPDILQNKPSISLRWIMTSNTRSSGEGEVTTGRSQIDNIMIEGMFSDEFKLVVIDVENPEPIEVEAGTTFSDLGLPETVLVFFDDESSDELPVLWLEGDYDGNTQGTYTLEGEIEINEITTENPLDIKAEIEVTVITRHTVTFNVDMSEAAGFDPENDEVYIRGDMNNWTIPGTNPETQLLEPANDKSLRYTIAFQLEEGPYEYKYYINAGLDNPEGGDNRSIDVVDDKVVNDTWAATGITEILKTAIKIYPNPAKSHINISSEYMMNQVRVINLQGQVVLNHEIQNKFYTLSTDGLTGGIYFIEVTTQEGIISEKLIINK